MKIYPKPDPDAGETEQNSALTRKSIKEDYPCIKLFYITETTFEEMAKDKKMVKKDSSPIKQSTMFSDELTVRDKKKERDFRSSGFKKQT